MAAATRGRRGPKPNPDRGSPSGYRITDRARFELGMASLFTGRKSLQDTIDLAVEEFLGGLRAQPGFTEALESAEHNQQQRSQIPSINSTDRDRE